jgi:aromatic ring-opening dioxygenase catalytic subunit (LigB family)
MFGLETDIPIIEVSIDSSYDPEAEWKIGQILDELRYVWSRIRVMQQLIDSIVRRRSNGILLLSGGLTIHNLRDRACFHETQSAEIYRKFDNAVTQAVQVRDVSGFCRPFPRARIRQYEPSGLARGQTPSTN